MNSKFSAPLALIAAALFSSAAMAAHETKIGEVKSIDTAKHDLVLTSGETFHVGSHVKLENLKIGEKITVTFETKDGKMKASKVEPAK